MKSKVNNTFLEEIPIHLVQYSEVISAAKPLFNFSRVFGIPGFSYIDSIVSKGGFCSFLNFWNIFLLTNQIFLLIVTLAKGEDFVKKSGIYIIMRVHVISVHIWSLLYTPKLAKALRNAPALENRLKIYKDAEAIRSLRKICVGVTVIYVILSLFLTGKSFFIELAFPSRGGGSPDIAQAWESYGSTNCKLDGNTFYHPSITSSYCVLMSLATNFVWVFSDFLLVILAIVMGEMFRRLNRGVSSMEADRFSAVEIDLVREHHGLTSKLVSEFDDAISSLNLINIICNSAFLILGTYSLLIGIGNRTNRRNRPVGSTNSNSVKEQGMVVNIACKLAVVAFKFLAGLVAASILHRRAHAALSHVRSWPMAREFHDFSLHHGRASVIHAFLGQLSNPSIGFTFSKFATITAKLMAALTVGIGAFFVFTRIILSTCSRNSNRFLNP